MSASNTSPEPPPGRLLGRSMLAGLIAGALSAIVITIDATVRQPNFAPQSFLVAVAWLGPLLLAGGLVLGALSGLVVGAAAIPVSRLKWRRLFYVVACAVATAIVLALITHPNQWASAMPARAVALALGILVAAVAATRIFPRFER